MMLIFSMLSLPAYLLFWSGRTLNNPDRVADQTFSFPKFIASLSLANIGEISLNINQLDLFKSDESDPILKVKAPTKQVEMFCETGKIG